MSEKRSTNQSVPFEPCLFPMCHEHICGDHESRAEFLHNILNTPQSNGHWIKEGRNNKRRLISDASEVPTFLPRDNPRHISQSLDLLVNAISDECASIPEDHFFLASPGSLKRSRTHANPAPNHGNRQIVVPALDGRCVSSINHYLESSDVGLMHYVSSRSSPTGDDFFLVNPRSLLGFQCASPVQSRRSNGTLFGRQS